MYITFRPRFLSLREKLPPAFLLSLPLAFSLSIRSSAVWTNIRWFRIRWRIIARSLRAAMLAYTRSVERVVAGHRLQSILVLQAVYTISEKRIRFLSLSLSLSLSLWPEIRVYAGATNYSYNLVCLITCTDIYIVMILRRFMIALRAYDPYVRMLPRWSLFVAIAVAASSPSRQWLIYASERTRNSFNELDFAWRTNSFLHLHSVLAVNHFSARVTRHDRGESRIRLIFTFYSFSNPASFYIRSAGRFTMRSCDRGIDIRNVVPIFTIDILGNNRRCKRVPLFQIENLGARLATVKNYVKSRSH